MATTLQPYVGPDGAIFAPNETDATIQALYLGVANTAEAFTLTTGTRIVRIQADQDIYYEFDATAAAPSDEATEDASTYLRAGQERLVQTKGSTTLSCVSAVVNAAVNLLEWG